MCERGMEGAWYVHRVLGVICMWVCVLNCLGSGCVRSGRKGV